MEKIFTSNEDWNDEGDIFLLSIIEDSKLESLRRIVYLLKSYFPEDIEIHWGSNESFTFSYERIIDMLESAEDISEEKLEVLIKFDIGGIDIYDRLIDWLWSHIFYYYDHETEQLETIQMTKAMQEAIKDDFINIFSEDDWEEIIKDAEQI